MVTQVMPSDRDLRTLAGIVSQERPDLPETGLPFSLLSDVMAQIPCDSVYFAGFDSTRQREWFEQRFADGIEQCVSGPTVGSEAHWTNYWDCQPCSYPDRTGDLRSVLKIADFYSARQWHSTGMYCDLYRPHGNEHELMVTLPEPAGSDAGPGRTVRLFLFRGPGGPDFTERDRDLLTLLRPHLHHAFLDAERRRSHVPDLTPRQWELLHLISAGRTNIQIARQLGLSEGTVRTHLENIYRRLDVSNRTAAVMRALPEKTLMSSYMDIDVRPALPLVHAPALDLHRTGDRNGAGVPRPILGGAHRRRSPGRACLRSTRNDRFLVTDQILGEAEEFLTGARSVLEADRVLASVLFTDIVDSTRRAVELGDLEWRSLLNRHDSLAEREVVRYGGRLIKTTGDGVLATFDGPARSVRCAQALSDGAQALGIVLRAGVHTGEVELRGDDIAGLGVNIASRIESLAQPGEILVSRTVTDLVAGSGLDFDDRGEHDLKGVPGRWQLFAARP